MWGYAGIQTVIVRPPSDVATMSNSALHMLLFALAGLCQGTHMALEMRSSLPRESMLTFLKEYWAAPIPNAQPGLTALAATLTRLEVCTPQDTHLRCP